MSVLRAITKPLRDKARELPVRALQTAMNGFGQALLLGDRVRSTIKRLTSGESADGHRPAESEPVTAPPPPARREPVIYAPRPAPAERRAETPAEPAITKPAEPAVKKPAELAIKKPAEPAVTKPAEPAIKKPAEPAVTKPAVPTATPKVAPEPARRPSPEAATAAQPRPKVALPEPLPGYGELTFASLRARLRGKSIEQVQALLDYEKANANRPEVVKLFENRLTKLRTGG